MALVISVVISKQKSDLILSCHSNYYFQKKKSTFLSNLTSYTLRPPPLSSFLNSWFSCHWFLGQTMACQRMLVSKRLTTSLKLLGNVWKARVSLWQLELSLVEFWRLRWRGHIGIEMKYYYAFITSLLFDISFDKDPTLMENFDCRRTSESSESCKIDYESGDDNAWILCG